MGQTNPSGTNMVSLARYIGVTGLTIMTGYFLHPNLLQLTAKALDLTGGMDDTTFETSFFGLVSIVYGLFSGQTFLFLYERQVNIVQELYGEVFALELLLQQTFVACQEKELRCQMADSVREYLRTELYDPVDMESPFMQQSAYMRILNLILRMKREGIEVNGLREACEKLADAQSRRSAVAAQILPMAHWLFMHSMELIFVVTFLVFDAATVLANSDIGLEILNDYDSAPERRVLFAALCALLALTGQVLHDLSDPLEDLYTFKPAMDSRLNYVAHLIASLEKMPPYYVPASVSSLLELGMLQGMSESKQVPETASPIRRGARPARVTSQHSYPGGPLRLWGARRSRVGRSGSTAGASEEHDGRDAGSHSSHNGSSMPAGIPDPRAYVIPKKK